MPEDRAAQSLSRDRSDLSGVMAWDCGLVIPPEEYARMLDHPRLNDGLRALQAATLAATAADPILLGVFKDGGRYVSAMWSIYLHAAGGLSLQSLKDMCAQSGLLSPGRARALLLYMRYLGYVEPAPVRPRGTAAMYVPTARFRTAWTLHMRLVLEAACAIEPAGQAVVDRLDDPDIFDCVVRTQGESLFNGTRTYDMNTPLFRVFINRHAGTLIVAELLTGGEGADFPPHHIPVPSAPNLAARFQVSRIHVRRILSQAEKEGLLRRAGAAAAETYVLDDAFRDRIRVDHAMQLRHLMLSLARAAKAL